jgi:hypothetical protein
MKDWKGTDSISILMSAEADLRPHPPAPSPAGEGDKEPYNQLFKPLSPGREVGVRPSKGEEFRVQVLVQLLK